MNRNKKDIIKATKEGRAILQWRYGYGEIKASLVVYDSAEEAKEGSRVDTRNRKGQSKFDEVWCELCTSPKRAIKASRGLMVVR